MTVNFASSNSSQISNLATSSLPSFIDNQSLQITQHRLNGNNFQEWFHSILLVIRGKGKAGYLDGSLPPPQKGTTNYGSWEANNSVVMAWLTILWDLKQAGPTFTTRRRKIFWGLSSNLLRSREQAMFWDSICPPYDEAGAIEGHGMLQHIDRSKRWISCTKPIGIVLKRPSNTLAC